MNPQPPAAVSAKGREIARAMAFYLTPFVILLVTMGAVASGLHFATILALCVVAFTTAGNFVILEYLRRNPEKIASIRVIRIGFNYLFNIPIVYLLWPFWKPIWILFLPSILAVGLAEDKQTTTGTALMFSIVLVYVLFAAGTPTWQEGCEMAMYIATIWTTGLVVNRLTRIYAR